MLTKCHLRQVVAVVLKLPSRGRILVIAVEDDLLLAATSAVLTLVLADMQREAFRHFNLFLINRLRQRHSCPHLEVYLVYGFFQSDSHIIRSASPASSCREMTQIGQGSVDLELHDHVC